MKHTQRLGYQRLAEVLMERGLVEAQAVRDALEMGQRGSLPFPEALVSASLVADWELSRIVCEVFNLPFLPVEIADPDPAARAGLDENYLLEHGLVPLSRYGNVLTVAMPAVVPAEVLAVVAGNTGVVISPVVGTVRTNRRWIDEHFSPQGALPAEVDLAEMSGGEDDGEWANIFDEGDAAVQLELGDGDGSEDEVSSLTLDLGGDASEDASVESVESVEECETESIQLELGDGDDAQQA